MVAGPLTSYLVTALSGPSVRRAASPIRARSDDKTRRILGSFSSEFWQAGSRGLRIAVGNFRLLDADLFDLNRCRLTARIAPADATHLMRMSAGTDSVCEQVDEGFDRPRPRQRGGR